MDEELTTKQVAQRFGLTVSELDNWRSRRSGRQVPIRKDGNRVLWGSEALAMVADFVDKRRSKNPKYTDGALAYIEATESVALLGQRLRDFYKDFMRLHRSMRLHPPSFTLFIHSLPDPKLRLTHPLGIVVTPQRDKQDYRVYRAYLAELGLEAYGKTAEIAALILRDRLVTLYEELKMNPQRDYTAWLSVQQIIQETL